MNATTSPSGSPERFRENLAVFRAASERYWKDEALRGRVESGDAGELLAELGIELPAGTEAKVVANTPETFHVVLPVNPNVGLKDEQLSGIAGGACYSCFYASPCFG